MCVLLLYILQLQFINVMYTLNAVLFSAKLLPFFYKAGSSCFCIKRLVLPYLFLCDSV